MRFVASHSPTFRRCHLREVEGAPLFHRPPVVALATSPSSSPLGSFIHSGAAPSQPPAAFCRRRNSGEHQWNLHCSLQVA
ncbi:hypothetical protein PIB30_076314 [Stylosanthes scabra]|uniref:Uncharacterized protein n=1 Tax=Stylosanthes scabra TaxID=79078 RepID=A0ABU6TRL9_9FABA|nr:hypothetical protein [Stylosanthes scabra]